jgi:DNA-binding GntR family transcriptional regulator
MLETTVSESTSVAPVSGLSVTDQVVDTLRTAILAGRLSPGHEFSLRQIAAQLGVSFIPVREALRSLEAEGLLVIRPGRSATVAPLRPAEISDLFALRRQIEPERAGAAVARHTETSLDRLHELLSPCSDPEAQPDVHARAHLEFHAGLLRLDAVTIDGRVIITLIRATSRYTRRAEEALGPPPEQHRRRGNPHLDLLAAFRVGTTEVARAALIDYLEHTEQLAYEGLLVCT